LGIAALEDKVVQYAVGTVLNQIWEEDFLGFSYGFRPGRSQHDALDALNVGIARKKVNWVLDLDIRAFFDQIDHAWMIKFVEHRVGDRRIVRLIQKWLKAGAMEQGRWSEAKEGTPQGAVISPILANLYLHYVLDLWVNQWRRKEATGDVIIVRYADDAVLGFQHRYEAERFLEQLRERLGKFGLELNSEKTRLIEFGRFAAQNRQKRGQGKPETFTFLGFIHMCGTSYKAGYFAIPRKTIGKRMAAKLKEVKAQLQRRRHESTADTLKWLQSVVRGYFRYHAVPGNEQQMRAFRKDVLRLWLRQLRRRSQRSRWTWERFLERLAVHIPFARTEHPYPNARFDAKYPR
jgi:group II intron reverse transcriptase/maturase